MIVPTVKSVMNKKLQTIPQSGTLHVAARLMKSSTIGSLLVQKGKEYTGILTETDIVQKAVATNLPASITRVEEVMTFSLLTIEASSSIHKAAELMMEECVRHLAVTEKKKIIGIISIRDILQTEELPWISVRKIMSSAIFMVARASNVTEAAKLMRYNRIRSLLVTGRSRIQSTEPFLLGNGKEITGILTETDIIRKVVAEELNPMMTSIEKVMSRSMTVINTWKRTANACDLMAKNKIRHLPVMEGEEIVGIVSMRDLINPLYYNPFCHSRSVQMKEMKK